MEDNYNRGNSYVDNDSRGNNRDENNSRPKRKRIYVNNSNSSSNSNSGYNSNNSRNYGNNYRNNDGGYRKSYNHDNQGYGNRRYNNDGDNQGGYRNNQGYNRKNYDNNGGYQKRDYNRNFNNSNDYQDNEGGFRNNRGNGNYNNYGNNNGGYQKRNYNGGNYRNNYGSNNYGNDNNRYRRNSSNYTVDENGFHHKKYWDHSDRKEKAIDNDAEREDDLIFNDGKIRLNKYLSNSGMCSRREADRMIKAGMVSVNGEVITEMGVKVNITDEVTFSGQLIKPEKKRYLLLNKPKDYITTLRDPHARNTVMELIEGACKERVYPVGRLDRNTTGILLFTNDGDLAKKLTHPSNEVQKIYQVTLDKVVSQEDMNKISTGFELEDGFINADEIAYTDDSDKSVVGIRIHSGRNRIVRRIFEALGYDVKKLDRVMFAGLDKKGLSRGRWRFLTDAEVGYLYMISNKNGSDKAMTEALDFED